MNLLTDFFITDTLRVINESGSNPGSVKVKGVFGRADEFNNNNRRYKKTILEREIGRLKPLITERRLLGELDHPEYTSVKLTNASHVITGLYWEGNKLIGEAELLNTPSGKVAQQLLKDGVKIGISSRGLGSLQECADSKGKFEVSEDYKMVTFDLVADPSTRGAFPTAVSESFDLMQRTKKLLEKEQLFVVSLKRKLKEHFNKEEDTTSLEAQSILNKINKIVEGSMGIKRLTRVVNKQSKDTKKELDSGNLDAGLNSFSTKNRTHNKWMKKFKDGRRRKLNKKRLA
jgi:hypothetical protein